MAYFVLSNPGDDEACKIKIKKRENKMQARLLHPRLEALVFVRDQDKTLLPSTSCYKEVRGR